MGLSFRKSIKVGPMRLNISKSGVGYSIGAGGVRYTKSPKRKTTKKPSKSAPNKQAASKPQKQIPVASKESQTAAKSAERSWALAIIMPIIAFIVVGGICFIAAFICYVIVSLFAPDFVGSLGSKLLVFGVPIVLGLIFSLILFFMYRPLKDKKKQSI